MKCKKIKNDIYEYVDGELNEIQIHLIEEHLCECEECKQFFLDLKKAWNIIGELPIIKPKDTFVSSFWMKLAYNDSILTKLKYQFLYIFNYKLPIAKLVLVSSLFFVVYISYDYYRTDEALKNMLVNVSNEELELLVNYDLLTNYDLINTNSDNVVG